MVTHSKRHPLAYKTRAIQKCLPPQVEFTIGPLLPIVGELSMALKILLAFPTKIFPTLLLKPPWRTPMKPIERITVFTMDYPTAGDPRALAIASSIRSWKSPFTTEFYGPMPITVSVFSYHCSVGAAHTVTKIKIIMIRTRHAVDLLMSICHMSSF